MNQCYEIKHTRVLEEEAELIIVTNITRRWQQQKALDTSYS
jgi:hypothetical protein